VARLKVKVVPGASRSDVVGWLGDALKVRVAAAPERGKANAAVITLLAQTLGVSERDVRLVSGFRSPLKTFEAALLSAADMRQRLAGGGVQAREHGQQ
jgi:uncharacterized protein